MELEETEAKRKAEFYQIVHDHQDLFVNCLRDSLVSEIMGFPEHFNPSLSVEQILKDYYVGNIPRRDLRAHGFSFRSFISDFRVGPGKIELNLYEVDLGQNELVIEIGSYMSGARFGHGGAFLYSFDLQGDLTLIKSLGMWRS